MEKIATFAPLSAVNRNTIKNRKQAMITPEQAKDLAKREQALWRHL
jgi:hypothetical protein